METASSGPSSVAPAPSTEGDRLVTAYVHFPYCLQKCPYCDFASYKTPRDAIDHRGYADAVIAELEGRAKAWSRNGRPGGSGKVLRSIFFGGGTPSLWEPRELGRVLAALKATFRPTADLEVTVECNPTSLDGDGAKALRDVGVNRLSIGTQSLRADQLHYLGRLHDKDGALASIRGAVASGIERVSTDLIFGLPGQTPEDARDQAATLADEGLSHLSCYQLTIEPGTQFGELAKRGRLPLADDGMVAESFLAIDETLGARGFEHYEISNYARPGQASRHNLSYWKGHEYLGLGAGAFGCIRHDAEGACSALRYRNPVIPAAYVANAANVSDAIFGDGDGLADTSERLDGTALLRERIMLGLRLAEGFDLEEAARELGVEPWPREREREARWLEARGRLVVDGHRLRIPMRSWLWADDTAARLF